MLQASAARGADDVTYDWGMPQDACQPILLIQNAGEMPRLRDHVQLDLALCRTIANLAGDLQRPCFLRMFRPSTLSNRFLLTTRAEQDMLYLEETYFDAEDLPPELNLACKRHAVRLNLEPASALAASHAAWIPIVSNGNVLAVIEVRRSERLRNEELTLIRSAVTLYENYLSLLYYSETDTLTGLINRKTLDQTMERIFAMGNTATHALKAPSQPERRATASADNWLKVMDHGRGPRQAGQRPLRPSLRR
ncbi:MAG: hypothetical protein MO853_02850 [Candidatus Protistobacter heckmanni]|nr:hypothetical protein [Candidatus Protistobacter heckmanni]